MLDSPYVEYIGEIGDADKSAFLSGAIALLVPIDWPEPFGLVMIEAMACGTPVIAYNRGSVPEIIEEGLTGFIVEDEAGAIGAVDRLSHLSRTKIRQRFEERFTARRMALDYLSVYRSADGHGEAAAAGRGGRGRSADCGVLLLSPQIDKLRRPRRLARAIFIRPRLASLSARVSGISAQTAVNATAAITARPKNAAELPK